MPRFDVDFVDPKKFFYPGELIVGKIIVRVDESAVNCDKITLKFKGKSYVRWETGSRDDRKTHKNSEEYFKHEISLLEPVPPDKDLTFLPGEFELPFRFQLPNNLPPTVDHTPWVTGYIRYYMKIKLHVGHWRLKSDVQEKLPFKIVASPTDMSQIRNMLEPATATEEKFLCCLCCQSGPIRLAGSIQKQAYHLGEQIVFSFELDNKQTDKALRSVEARLMMKFKYFSDFISTREYESAKSSVLLSEGVGPRGEDSWNNVTLNIPTDAMPSFNNCKCMHLNYFFIVNVDIAGAFDPQISFPIVILSSPQAAQPTLQPPSVAIDMMHSGPGVPYPPATNMPPGGPIPLAPYPPLAEGYPTPTITQQPINWNPDVAPPAYPGDEKK